MSISSTTSVELEASVIVHDEDEDDLLSFVSSLYYIFAFVTSRDSLLSLVFQIHFVLV